jgi:hypothetical protein
MDVIQQVFDISEVILASEPQYVWINKDGVDALIKQMKEDGVPSFYQEEPEQDNKPYKTGVLIDILIELVASSINYNYWYGQHDIRPNNVSSSSMYDSVHKVFNDAKTKSLNFENRVEHLIYELSINRYPLLEDRKRHLRELNESRRGEEFAQMVYSKRFSGTRLLHEMVEMFQGFASDIFLKRASLFFIQLYRKFGWYKDDLMRTLHVPADYQVPKILRHFKCIEYSDALAEKVDNSVLIATHSLEELQIRAATVKVCTMLQYALKWTIADVDTYLWTKRKLTDTPFHLTYTTDY